MGLSVVLDTTGVILGPAYPFVAVGQDILEGDGRYTFANGPTIYFRMAGEYFSFCVTRF